MLNITKISSFMDAYLVAKDKHLKRFGILPVELTLETIKEIQSLPNTHFSKPNIYEFGRTINIYNTRLHTFIVHGTKCVCCGIKASFFAVEINKAVKDVPILNLYAINEKGEEVLMNMDHRLPRAKGGADHIDNMQTMCQPCNLAKGCKMIFTEGGFSKMDLILLEEKRFKNQTEIQQKAVAALGLNPKILNSGIGRQRKHWEIMKTKQTERDEKSATRKRNKVNCIA